MARECEARCASVLELATDLRAFLEGRVVRAHRTGAWVEARNWVRRNRALSGALGRIGLALAAGLAMSLLLLRDAQRGRASVFRRAQARTPAILAEEAERLHPPHPSRLSELRG